VVHRRPDRRTAVIAIMLAAWLAGVLLGWQLGVRRRHVNEERAFWDRLSRRRSDQYDWAQELGL
jgi:hypothetical protein